MYTYSVSGYDVNNKVEYMLYSRCNFYHKYDAYFNFLHFS